MRFQSQKECLFTAGWDQTIWSWVKAKPTFRSSSIPCWGAACLCAGLPQGLRPHLPLGLPPSWSFAFLPPRRLPQVSQARVCPRTFLLWSQCRAPRDQPSPLSFLQRSDFQTACSDFRIIEEKWKSSPDSTVPFPLIRPLWLCWSRAPWGAVASFLTAPLPLV